MSTEGARFCALILRWSGNRDRESQEHGLVATGMWVRVRYLIFIFHIIFIPKLSWYHKYVPSNEYLFVPFWSSTPSELSRSMKLWKSPILSSKSLATRISSPHSQIELPLCCCISVRVDMNRLLCLGIDSYPFFFTILTFLPSFLRVLMLYPIYSKESNKLSCINWVAS